MRIGIVGATGAVGVEIIKCLHAQKFPVDELVLFTSSRSSGKCLETPFGEILTKEYNLDDARRCQIVFLAVSGDFALENGKLLIGGDGPIVIDNSSAFRYDTDIPLVVSQIDRFYIA